MQTHVGDHLVIPGHSVDAPTRDGEILEVHGTNGTPPYLVQWSEDGHIGLVFPGPDAHVDHLAGTQTLPGDDEIAATP